MTLKNFMHKVRLEEGKHEGVFGMFSLENKGAFDQVFAEIVEILENSNFWKSAPFDWIYGIIMFGDDDDYTPKIQRIEDGMLYIVITSVELQSLRYSEYDYAKNRLLEAVSGAMVGVADHYGLSKDFLDDPALTEFKNNKAIINVIAKNEAEDLDLGEPPERIIIGQDDDLARYIGNTANGKQFFLTTPFVPAIGAEKGGEFVVLYLFDEEGNFEEAKFESLGPRVDSDADNREDNRSQILEDMLNSLKDPVFGNIHIKPFSVEKYGTEFGLILFANSGQWSASVMPGDYMAFSAPWDRGFYDT